MYRLIKFYNQNRYLFWLIVLILIAIVAMLQILNKVAFKDTNKKFNNENIKETINKNYSVITGQEIKDEASEIIEQFIDYCNSKQVEKAYELLSKECKEILYPSLKDFEQKYYYNIFKEKKNYLYQAWITQSKSYTYKIDFVDDMLATGTASKTSISDYYTVIENDGKHELNINKFIGIEDINKTQASNKIQIKIIRKKIYMDYEIYELEINNNSKKQIKLDSLQTDETVYLEADNGQKYYVHNHEILEDDVIVRRGENKYIELKFGKEYQPRVKNEKIIFSNIMINDNQPIEIDVLLK